MKFFDVDALPGRIFEAKALVGGERQGYFVGVIRKAWTAKGDSKDREPELEVQVCGASDREFLDIVQKKWKNPCSFFLSRRVTTESKEFKRGKNVFRPICALRFIEFDALPELEWMTKRSVCAHHVRKTLVEMHKEGEISEHLVPRAKTDKKETMKEKVGSKRDKESSNDEELWKHVKQSKKEIDKQKEKDKDKEKPKEKTRTDRRKGTVKVSLHDSGSESVSGEADGAPGNNLHEDLRQLRDDLTDGRGRKADPDRRGRSQRKPEEERRKDHQGEESRKSALRKPEAEPRGSPPPVRPAPEREHRHECPFGSTYVSKTMHRRRKNDKEPDARSRKRRHGSDRDSAGSDVSSCSSASAVFRAASTSTNKPCRERLVKFAEDHPGRLAERFLRRMVRKVMVEGEASNHSAQAVPIVAKAYHLRVTQLQFPDAQRRNLVEGNVMAHVLDHLAARRYGQAADLCAQRYTALEANNSGQPWEKAKFLELVHEEDNSLVGQHERALVAHESAQEIKIGGAASYQPNHWKGNSWNWAPDQHWKGKGKDKRNPFADQEAPPAFPAMDHGDLAEGKGKGKNKKGKGKHKKF